MRYLSVLFVAPFLIAAASTTTKTQEDAWSELHNQAIELSQEQRFAEAMTKCEEALHFAESVFGPTHRHVGESLVCIGGLHAAQGHYAAAEPFYQRGLPILEGAFGAEAPSLALFLDEFAEIYRKQGNYAAAEPLYQRALAIWEQVRISRSREGKFIPASIESPILDHLGQLYQAQEKYAEAERLYQQAIAIYEEAHETHAAPNADLLEHLASLYRKLGNPKEAKGLENQAKDIDLRAATNLERMASALRQEGGDQAAAKEATRWEARAKELRAKWDKP